MSDIKPFPEFISHKELKIFLSSAQQERSILDDNNIDLSESKENFDDLIKRWLSLSEDLIEHLQKNENHIENKKSSKSLLALGAMGAHVNMAIQALKAYESESE